MTAPARLRQLGRAGVVYALSQVADAACAGSAAITAAKPNAATAHNNLALMVILGLPYPLGMLV